MFLPLRRVLLTLVFALSTTSSVALQKQASKTLRHRSYANQLDAQVPLAFNRGPSDVDTVKDTMFENPLASGKRPTHASFALGFMEEYAAEFYVNGSKIPLVDWDVGSSWAGLLPISAHPNETRKARQDFLKVDPPTHMDDVARLFSSSSGTSLLDPREVRMTSYYGLMEGLVAPLRKDSCKRTVWMPGQARATPNEYSWTNLSGVLWVDQPIGTGYSVGTPNITNENQLAEQLVGFFQQFLEVFSELKGKNLYISGESYAGMYVPYTAHHIYENPGALDLSLKGFWISDPLVTHRYLQDSVPAVKYMHQYENVFSLNQSFVELLDSVDDSCGYTRYLETYITYPPKPAPFPLPQDTEECINLWESIYNATMIMNSGFNVYQILNTWPRLWDVLGAPTQVMETQVSPLYFDRDDVKRTVHVPADTNWTVCSDAPVFVNDTDTSVPPFLSIMPDLIEKSERVVVVHGLLDYVLMPEGVRLAIQNMTWNGVQGFQTPIEDDTLVVPGVGAVGRMHSERGLTYYEVAFSGHMVPQNSPWAAMHIMQYLMGFRDTP
ncbi:uncharacterized protein FIBRA_08854 [Fibroporia radiculosa]|uniref:Carboxypeptidase n=1 Tax=Fibroporia radiculosa TaxID=599839 RepID=J4ICK6_9APHY|nr:uncharacterized protein FIBRA_08854 [Fibroporia radiculosa]CCM06576.1 predicted protein [Fibroporia radiculosa]